MSTPSERNTRDWSAYNRAPVERGALEVRIDEEALALWTAEADPCKRGRPHLYSDAAIVFALTLREAYHLTLRAARGFAASVFRAMGVGLPVPHYSTLSRRAGGLAIDLGASPAAGPRVVLLDSTGLKVFGEGEWKVRKHGYSKRRTWRKLHLAVDARTQGVVACTATDNAATDASQVGELLGEVGPGVECIKADGAYDQRPVYEAAAGRNARVVIPPRRNAKVRKHGNARGPRGARDENLRGCRRHGWKGWKNRSGYHERSLVETAMYRVKVITGERLKSRKIENQRAEARVKCRVINRVTRLGMLATAA